jgi:hypothetical protein
MFTKIHIWLTKIENLFIYYPVYHRKKSEIIEYLEELKKI